jgi:hypothetical protein
MTMALPPRALVFARDGGVVEPLGKRCEARVPVPTKEQPNDERHTLMKPLLLRLVVAFALALGAVTLRSAPAMALGVTSYAQVIFTNNTPCDLAIPSDGTTVNGTWNPAPPTSILPGQTITFGSYGHGTGGTIQIPFPQNFINGDTVAPEVGTITWAIPWADFTFGLGWQDPTMKLVVQPTAVTDSTGNNVGTFAGWAITNLGTPGGGYSSNGSDTEVFEIQMNEVGTGAQCSPTKLPSDGLNSVTVPSIPAGGVNSLGVLTSYWDSAHGTEYVFYEDNTGNVDALSCGPGACWKSQVVAAAGWMTPGSSLISYYDGTNGHLFFQGTNGSADILELKGNPPTTSATVTDVTAQTNPSNGGPGGFYYPYTTAAGASASAITTFSNLTGFWDGNNDHVFYMDGAGNTHESYYDNGSWWDHIVAAATSLAYTPGNTLRSLWDGVNEHVYISFMSQGGWAVSSYPSGNWTPTTIPYSGGEGFNLTPVALTGWTGIEVLLAGSPSTMNQIDAMYNDLEGGYTTWFNLSTPAVDYAWQVPTLAYTDGSGSAELFFVGPTNGHVYLYSQFASPAIDLSASPGNNGAIVDTAGTPAGLDLFSPLSGFFDGTYDHLFFFDTSGNVEEIYWTRGSSYYQEHVIGGNNSALGMGEISNYQQ